MSKEKFEAARDAAAVEDTQYASDEFKFAYQTQFQCGADWAYDFAKAELADENEIEKFKSLLIQKQSEVFAAQTEIDELKGELAEKDALIEEMEAIIVCHPIEPNKGALLDSLCEALAKYEKSKEGKA